MIADSHAHVILPVEKHIALMDEAGIDKTVLFSTSIHPELAGSLNEYEEELNILYEMISGKRNAAEAKIASIKEQHDIIEKYPSRFCGFGNVPLGLDYNKTASWVEEYIIKNKYLGIGEVTAASGQISSLESLFQAAHDFADLPVWIHGFWPLELEDIKEIFAFAKSYPSVPIIMGHLGGVNWLEVVKAAKEMDNLYIDLSAAYAVVAMEMAIRELPERCLFSSDLPYGDLMVSKFSVERACRDLKVKAQVLGGNIQRLLNI